MDLPNPNPADEGVHEPGDDPLWNESWYFDFVNEDASIGGYVRIGRYPNLGAIWYWACVLGPDRKLVIAVDHAVPFPTDPASNELHGALLWADHTCRVPLEHWSLGLETHAVALDDPADTYRGSYGDTVPFAFELDWETNGAVFAYPTGLDRYEVPCRVHGEITVGTEVIDLAGVGQRDHSWGPRDWWTMSWCWSAFHLDDGTQLHGVQIRPQGIFQIGYVQPGDAGAPSGLEPATTFTADEVLGDEGIPERARLVYGTDERVIDLDLEPTGWAPVLLTAPDGRLSRFPRGMGRVTAADGRRGVGWLEFNQPQVP